MHAAMKAMTVTVRLAMRSTGSHALRDGDVVAACLGLEVAALTKNATGREKQDAVEPGARDDGGWECRSGS